MKRNTLFILVFAVFVYLFFGFVTQIFYNYFGDAAQKVMDTPSYFYTGENFFRHFRADSMRTLGYPFLLGLPFLFTTSWAIVQQWGFCLNLIAWCLSAVFLYKTICLYSSERYAMFFTIIFILCFGNLEYVFMLLSENVYTCILMATVYLFTVFLAKKKIDFLAWAFVLFSFSILVRPTLWPIYIISFLICALVGFKANKVFSKQILGKYWIILGFGVLLIAFQLGMMKKTYGYYTLSYNGDKTMYVYLGAFVESIKTGESLQLIKAKRSGDIYKYISSSRFDRLDSMCSNNMRTQLKNDPRIVFKALRTDIIVNSNMPGEFDTRNVKNWPFFELQKSACYFITGWQNAIFTFFAAISGIIALLRRKRMNKEVLAIILFNWVTACLTIIISGISFWQFNRFSVVYTPEVLVNMVLLIWTFSNKTQLAAK